MDREQIDTFLTLVTYKNFTKTAEMLHVAQSTVSARLKSLEMELGKTLLERTNKGVELTHAGYTFLPYAKRMFELFEESRKELSLEGQYIDRLVLGGPSSAWNYIFGDALSTFAVENSNVSLELKTHSSENTISKVLDGVIDVGISYTKPTHPNLIIHGHMEDQYTFVSRCPRNTPIKVGDLHSKNFILNNWGDNFLNWFVELTDHNYLPALSMNQTTIVLKMLQKQNYFTLMPSLIAQSHIDSGELHYLANDFDMPLHHIYIFTSKNVKKEMSVNRILEMLNNQYIN